MYSVSICQFLFRCVFIAAHLIWKKKKLRLLKGEWNLDTLITEDQSNEINKDIYTLLQSPRRHLDRSSQASAEDFCPFSQYLLGKVNDPAQIHVSCTVPVYLLFKEYWDNFCIEFAVTLCGMEALKGGQVFGLSFCVPDLLAPYVGKDLWNCHKTWG